MHLARGRSGPALDPRAARSVLLLLVLALALAFPGVTVADTPYVVEAGDTLYDIAMYHGVTEEELARTTT